MAESIDHGTTRGGFLIKKHDFWAPFFRRFFDFCQKWRKCEISEEYNAKRGSEPSKPSIFASIFHQMFMFFQNPFQTAFLEGPSARLASKVRFWSDFRFSRGHKIDPWGAIFGQNGSKG